MRDYIAHSGFLFQVTVIVKVYLNALSGKFDKAISNLARLHTNITLTHPFADVCKICDGSASLFVHENSHNQIQYDSTHT